MSYPKTIDEILAERWKFRKGFVRAGSYAILTEEGDNYVCVLQQEGFTEQDNKLLAAHVCAAHNAILELAVANKMMLAPEKE